jgi:hypothetical protein
VGELTRRQLLRRGALAGVWAVPTVQGVSMFKSAAAAVSPAPFGCGAPAKNAAVRFKSFGNTGSNEIYLGVGNLGIGGNRVEQDFTWSAGDYPIEFEYFAASPYRLETRGAFGTMTYLLGGPLDPMDSFEILVAARHGGDTQVEFDDVRLNGALVGTGSFEGDGTYRTWVFPSTDLNSGFLFTGTVRLIGSFPKSGDELSKVEILTGCDVGNLA